MLNANTSPAFERVCSVAELQRAGRLEARLATGRVVLVVAHSGGVIALDARCYHHGAPLVDGDIEELGGRQCIVCPWHRYRIAIDGGAGECLYIGVVDIATGATVVKSKGVKQRAHAVRVDGDDVLVADSSTATPGLTLPSDAYAMLEVAPPRPPDAGGVPLHSSFAARREPR